MPKLVAELVLALSILEAFQMVSVLTNKEESEDLFLSFSEGANLSIVRINIISNVYAFHSKLCILRELKDAEELVSRFPFCLIYFTIRLALKSTDSRKLGNQILLSHVLLAIMNSLRTCSERRITIFVFNLLFLSASLAHRPSGRGQVIQGDLRFCVNEQNRNN